MSPCDEVLGALHAYVAAALPDDEQDTIRAHLLVCERCWGLAADESLLHASLERAVVAPIASSRVKRLLARSRARVAAGPRLAAVPALVAAGLMIVATAGLLLRIEPRCLVGDCVTQQLIMDALETAPVRGPAPPLGGPDLPGLQAVGVGHLATAAGVPVAVYARERTRLIVFQEARAHSHVWYGQRLADGRRYLVMAIQDGRHVLGWVDPSGLVWCCVGEDMESTLALAAELRRRAS